MQFAPQRLVFAEAVRHPDAGRYVQLFIESHHETDRFVAVADDDVEFFLSAIVEQGAFYAKSEPFERGLRETEIPDMFCQTLRLAVDRFASKIRRSDLEFVARERSNDLFREFLWVVRAVVAFEDEL